MVHQPWICASISASNCRDLPCKPVARVLDVIDNPMVNCERHLPLSEYPAVRLTDGSHYICAVFTRLVSKPKLELESVRSGVTITLVSFEPALVKVARTKGEGVYEMILLVHNHKTTSQPLLSGENLSKAFTVSAPGPFMTAIQTSGAGRCESYLFHPQREEAELVTVRLQKLLHLVDIGLLCPLTAVCHHCQQVALTSSDEEYFTPMDTMSQEATRTLDAPIFPARCAAQEIVGTADFPWELVGVDKTMESCSQRLEFGCSQTGLTSDEQVEGEQEVLATEDLAKKTSSLSEVGQMANLTSADKQEDAMIDVDDGSPGSLSDVPVQNDSVSVVELKSVPDNKQDNQNCEDSDIDIMTVEEKSIPNDSQDTQDRECSDVDTVNKEIKSVLDDSRDTRDDECSDALNVKEKPIPGDRQDTQDCERSGVDAVNEEVKSLLDDKEDTQGCEDSDVDIMNVEEKSTPDDRDDAQDRVCSDVDMVDEEVKSVLDDSQDTPDHDYSDVGTVPEKVKSILEDGQETQDRESSDVDVVSGEVRRTIDGSLSNMEVRISAEMAAETGFLDDSCNDRCGNGGIAQPAVASNQGEASSNSFPVKQSEIEKQCVRQPTSERSEGEECSQMEDKVELVDSVLSIAGVVFFNDGCSAASPASDFVPSNDSGLQTSPLHSKVSFFDSSPHDVIGAEHSLEAITSCSTSSPVLVITHANSSATFSDPEATIPIQDALLPASQESYNTASSDSNALSSAPQIVVISDTSSLISNGSPSRECVSLENVSSVSDDVPLHNINSSPVLVVSGDSLPDPASPRVRLSDSSPTRHNCNALSLVIATCNLASDSKHFLLSEVCSSSDDRLESMPVDAGSAKVIPSSKASSAQVVSCAAPSQHSPVSSAPLAVLSCSVTRTSVSDLTPSSLDPCSANVSIHDPDSLVQASSLAPLSPASLPSSTESSPSCNNSEKGGMLGGCARTNTIYVPPEGDKGTRKGSLLVPSKLRHHRTIKKRLKLLHVSHWSPLKTLSGSTNQRKALVLKTLAASKWTRGAGYSTTVKRTGRSAQLMWDDCHRAENPSGPPNLLVSVTTDANSYHGSSYKRRSKHKCLIERNPNLMQFSPRKCQRQAFYGRQPKRQLGCMGRLYGSRMVKIRLQRLLQSHPPLATTHFRSTKTGEMAHKAALFYKQRRVCDVL